MDEFLDLLVRDKDVRSEFFSQTTTRGAYNVARRYMNNNVSYDEFFDKVASLCTMLTEEELGKVAGGCQGFCNIASIIPDSFKRLFV